MKVPKFWLDPIQGYDPWRKSEAFHFDPRTAKRVCDFFPKHFRHGKGEFAGKPFKLEPWQRRHIGHLFGWKRKDGTRRYREMFLYVPKKNGKTQEAAGISIILLAADNEPGAEVYSASGDRDQANIIFEAACYMVENDPALSNHFKILPGYKVMKYPATESYWKVLSSEAKTKHGPNIHGLLLDELHVFPNNELIETLQRGTVNRRQPLTIYMTTADHERPSPCNELLKYAQDVRDGVIDDPFFLPVIYEAAKEDDWTSEAVWRKVNPNYGITVKRSYFESEVRKAKANPSKAESFKRLHLNIQTKTERAWMSLHDWDCSGQKIEKDSLLGKRCYGGLDLSSSVDITAFALFFPAECAVLAWFWVPRKTAEKRLEYALWQNDGYIESVGERVIDQQTIRDRVKTLAKQYQILDIAYDPWNASQLAKQLADEDRLPMIEFRQGYKSMNEPSKELEKLIIQHKLIHFGNPVLRWMASNAQVKGDEAGNIKLIKPNKDSPQKIDGIIALVMGVGLSIAKQGEDQESVYEKRGVRFI